MIIPGNSGETLADQTCPHFPNWLNDIIASKNKSTVIWIFRHDLRIDTVASWFSFCEAGEDLLQNLTDMQNGDGLVRMRLCLSASACTDRAPSQRTIL